MKLSRNSAFLRTDDVIVMCHDSVMEEEEQSWTKINSFKRLKKKIQQKKTQLLCFTKMSVMIFLIKNVCNLTSVYLFRLNYSFNLQACIYWLHLPIKRLVE